MMSGEIRAEPAPLLASSRVAASGSYPSGQAHTTSRGNLAASRSHECVMLLPSPAYTTWHPGHGHALWARAGVDAGSVLMLSLDVIWLARISGGVGE